MAGTTSGVFAMGRATSGLYVSITHMVFRASHVDVSHLVQCLKLGTSNLVAYYDVKPSPEPTYHSSGNVLTIQENYIYLAVGKYGLRSEVSDLRCIHMHNQNFSPL